MVRKIRLPFTESDPRIGSLSAFAYISIKLTHQSFSLQLAGLLDTGASVNVLPYEVGLNLGMTWEAQNLIIPLGGNLAHCEAKSVILSAQISNFEPVDLAFAWSSDRNAPLILGQTNFFQMFDVCFYRAELAFEVSVRRSWLNKLEDLGLEP